MASYNGENFIRVQIESILNQLGPDDELIIVDDMSTDSTVKIISGFEDVRILLLVNAENIGVSQAFNRALSYASGDVIFLSDQDDRWFENKLNSVKNIFSTEDVNLIVHDAVLVLDGKLTKVNLFDLAGSSSGILKNIYKNTFTGCCMAFSRDVLHDILPISTRIGIYHDAWIGVLAQCFGYKIKFISVPLIYFNRHGNNASSMKRRGIFVALYDRAFFIAAILMRITKKRFFHLHS
jgi:glycosyltransferase involved in cell wall biosynthesis